MHFKVHPSVLFQLGESLITDVVQAVVELVKNSYDADATRAVVRVETEGTALPEWTKHESVNGWIEVADNGDGMTNHDIENKWLIVSNRSKLEQKRAGRLTKKGRTPLGDKGLGRLGVQRLGMRVEMRTKAAGKDGIYVRLDWRDFMGKSDLADVDVLATPTDKKKIGTQILVSDLNNPEEWTGEGIHRLEEELGRVLSPYKRVKDFVVSASVNGRELEFGSIGDEVQRLSRIHYDLGFANSQLDVNVGVRMGFLRPRKQDREQCIAFGALVEADNGNALLQHLQSLPASQSLGIKRSNAKGLLVESHRVVKLESIDKLEFDGESIANPGPFRGEIDAFDLGYDLQDEIDESGSFDSVAQYRLYIKKFSGVRVFRDGFGIRMPSDWTGLGKQWTAGSSWYGLKPSNTIGYIAISARDNARLEETTDREGFKDTPYYRNLLGLLNEWLRYSGELHDFLRRGWLSFYSNHKDTVAGIQVEQTVEDVSSKVRHEVKRASHQVKSARSTIRELQKHMSAAEHTLEEAVSAIEAGSASKKIVLKLQEAIGELRVLVSRAESIQASLADATELEAFEALGDSLDERVKRLKEQLAGVYGAVAIGLSTEALAHELNAIVDRLVTSSRRIRKKLKAATSANADIGEYVEMVLSSSTAIRKQLAHINPGLKYLREQRDTFSMAKFLRDLCSFHRERLSGKNMNIVCSIHRDEDVNVKMNRGKLTQIMDNLVFNSEYWLGESVRRGEDIQPQINVELHSGIIRVSDTGPGVDPEIESTLFEPFVTRKRKYAGRGLGLYICRQLLDSDGCTIRLADKRNHRGHRHEFHLDMAGVILDE